MKRFYVGILALSIFPFIIGMGSGSGNVTHKIPVPEKNFSATIIDSEGVSTKVTQISFNGRSYLIGQRGNTTVTIPFEKIAAVQIGKSGGNKKVPVAVTLKDGGNLNITVDGTLPCYGIADFGNVQIEFKDIKKVEIHGIVPKEKP